MKLLGIVFVFMLFAGAGGYWYYSHASAQEKQKLQYEAEQAAREAQRDAIRTEMAAHKALMEKYKMFVQFCDEHEKGGNPNTGAYDGFSYDKKKEYFDEAAEEQARYNDLSARLNTVDDVNGSDR